MAVGRVVVYDFEGGTVGAPFTPNIGVTYGGSEDVYTEDNVGLVYDSQAATGTRSAAFLARGGSTYDNYYFTSTEGPVQGIEVSFKKSVVPGISDPDVDVMAWFAPNNGCRVIVNNTGLKAFWAYGDPAYDPNAPPTQYAMPLDVTQWFTIKVLPTGEWSFSYTHGATIKSGQATVPAQPDANGLYESWLDLVAYGSSLWFDDVAFWGEGLGSGSPPVVVDRVRRRFTSPDAVIVTRS